MFRRSLVARAALAALCGPLLSNAVQAQDASASPPEAAATGAPAATLNRVEVTGSRIKRVDAETPAPVQVITREQIDRTGATSVSEVLRRVPAGNTGAFNENAVSSFTPGASSISLRGLGAQATLVLIDGRRTTPYGFGSFGQQAFVDVNTIPLEMVERIEILLDGASAIYGSDAIGGVLNIILKKDYTGTEISAGMGTTSRFDGHNKRASFTAGRGSLAADKYNFFVNLSHVDQKEVKANERPNTKTTNYTRFGLPDRRSSYSYPGNLYTFNPDNPTGAGTGTFISPFLGCKPPNDGTVFATRCTYERVDDASIQAKAERNTLFMGGTIELPSGAQVFGGLSINRTEARVHDQAYASADYGYSGLFQFPYDAIILPAGHPQNPTGDPVALRYRFNDRPSGVDSVSTVSRVTLGVRGESLGWDLESALVYARSSSEYGSVGPLRDSVLNSIVDPTTGFVVDPTFVFGNPGANAPGVINSLYPRLISKGLTTSTAVDLRGTRDLMQLPAGPLGVAMGVEFRRETFKTTPDPLLVPSASSPFGQISAASTFGADGSRNVQSAYAEFSVPIVRTLEASLAGRFDNYSDAGSSTTPKVGLKWKALPNLALRATWAKGFRAPSLPESATAPSTGFYAVQDPVKCPIYDDANPDCYRGILANNTPNKDLKPETSRSISYGLVWDVVDDWSITGNVFNIKRTNEITSLDPNYVLANPGIYPGRVTRNPDTNSIESIRLELTNLGSTEVRGLDLELRGKVNGGEAGKFGLIGTFNYLPYYKVTPVPGAPTQNYAGYYQQPKQRWQIGVDREKGAWTQAVSVNYVGGYLFRYNPTDTDCPYAGTTDARCSISSMTTWDLAIGYKGLKNIELGFVIDNLFDKQAPIDARQTARLYDSAFHDALGRKFALRGKYTF
jgi:iron complex outermembrane receptor protein